MKARYFLLALAATALVACQEKDPETPAVKGVLTVSGATNNAVSADATGRTLNLTVKSNVSWTATSSESWVSVDPSEFTSDNKSTVSTKVSVKVAANESADARTAKISIAGEGVDAVEITVNQAGAVAEAKTINVWDMDKFDALEGYEVSLPYSESEATFVVHANGDWTASAPEWLTVEPASNKFDGNENITVTVKASKNDGDVRTGEIKFSGNFDNELVVPVSQSASVSFKFELVSVTHNRAQVKVTPSSDNCYWISGLFAKAAVDQYGVDAAVSQILSNLDQYLNNNTAEKILDHFGAMGEKTVGYMDLPSEMEFTLVTIAVGYDSVNGKFISESKSAVYSFATTARPEADPAYDALIGVYEIQTYSYFKKAAYTLQFEVSENEIDKSYLISFPNSDVDGSTGDSFYADFVAETKNLSIPNFQLGASGYYWSLGDGTDDCAIVLEFLLMEGNKLADAGDAVEFSLSEDKKTLSLSSVDIPEGQTFTVCGQWYQEAGETDFVTGYWMFNYGTSFTKVATDNTSSIFGVMGKQYMSSDSSVKSNLNFAKFRKF